MDLKLACNLIAAQVKVDPEEFYGYALQDTLGGYHIDPAKRLWPQGSAWAEELVLLYALVRTLKPTNIVEIGGWAGSSATHLATAVKANGWGHVISVDNGIGGMPHGHLIPDYLRDVITLVNADGRDWLAQQEDHTIGLLFEDADHSTVLVQQLATLAVQKVEQGGVMVNHDAAHDFAILGDGNRVNSSVGLEVREGLSRAGVYFRPYLVDPSDCGVAIVVMPGERKSESKRLADKYPVGKSHLDALSQVGNANIESMSEPPKIAEFQGIQGIKKGWAPQPTDTDFLEDDGNQHKEAEKPVTKRTRTRKAK